MLNTSTHPYLPDLLALRSQASNIPSLITYKRSADSNAGNQSSVYRGHGMDFEEVRAYHPGDDIRLMHWGLTARLGKAFTKIYREEKERSVYLIIDQSSSMKFGTRVAFKNVLSAKIAAFIGWCALKGHNQVGGLIFSDTGSTFVPPTSSHKALFGLFHLLTQTPSPHENIELIDAISKLNKRIKSGSLVFVISDYKLFNEEVQFYLQLIGRRCEITNIFTYDPLEAKLPDTGSFAFTKDGSEQLLINSNKDKVQSYHNKFALKLKQLREFSQQNHMRFMPIATNDDFIHIIKSGNPKL